MPTTPDEIANLEREKAGLLSELLSLRTVRNYFVKNVPVADGDFQMTREELFAQIDREKSIDDLIAELEKE